MNIDISNAHCALGNSVPGARLSEGRCLKLTIGTRFRTRERTVESFEFFYKSPSFRMHTDRESYERKRENDTSVAVAVLYEKAKTMFYVLVVR